MLLASRELYEQLADRCDNAFGLTKRGLLMLCRTRAGLEAETRHARQARQLDLPVEILAPARAADIDPGIGMDIAGAVFYPLDCHLDPRQLMRTLTELALAAGITIHWSTSLDGWRTHGRRVSAAVTSQGELIADEFVLAAGAWSAEAVRSLGCKLPLQAGKGYSFTLPNPPQLPRLCSILSDAREVAVLHLEVPLRAHELVSSSGARDPGERQLCGRPMRAQPVGIEPDARAHCSGAAAAIPQMDRHALVGLSGLHPYRCVRLAVRAVQRDHVPVL
jgi:D-amino-acid dehydrogenase